MPTMPAPCILFLSGASLVGQNILSALAGRSSRTGIAATARRSVEDQLADPTPFDQLLRTAGVA